MQNIMLSFLSTIRLDRQTGQPDYKHYPKLDSDGVGYTHSTNESGLRYVMKLLQEKNQQLDCYIAMNSSLVENEQITAPDGQKLTHYEYFKSRLQCCLDAYYGKNKKLADSVARKINYYENSSIDRSLSSVMEAVCMIKSMQSEQKDDRRVQLFLDLSGGPRDANMLLLIISRLLEYDDDISISEVIYSALGHKKNEEGIEQGCVQIISRAYSLLDLVAGMAEFTNFGSVNGLEKYFRAKNRIIDASLNNLLLAMHEFSDKMKLCRYGEFKQAIARLAESIQLFKQDCAEGDSDSKLVLAFMQQLEQKYQPLFVALQENSLQKQDLCLIKWCNDNDMIQQAMTLITERLPLYIFAEDKPILTVREDCRQDFYDDYKAVTEKDKEKHKATIDYKYWLLSSCSYNVSVDIKSIKVALYSALLACIKAAVRKEKVVGQRLQAVAEGFITKDFFWGEISVKQAEVYVAELGAFFQKSHDKQNWYDESRQPKVCIAEKLLQLTGQKQVSLKRLLGSLADKHDLTTYNGGLILKNDVDNVLDFFAIKVVDHSKGNYGKVYAALQKGILQTRYEQQDILRLLDAYFTLKDERNAINHAHDEKERVTFAELKKKIALIIQALERF